MKNNDIPDNGRNGEDVNVSLNINTDENMDGNQHLNEPVADESEVEKLKELIQTAGKDVITDLLDVLDDSERAQQQMETTNDVQAIKQGVQLVFSKLRQT